MKDIYSYYMKNQTEPIRVPRNTTLVTEQIRGAIQEFPDMRWSEFSAIAVRMLRGRPQWDFEQGICIEDGE